MLYQIPQWKDKKEMNVMLMARDEMEPEQNLSLLLTTNCLEFLTSVSVKEACMAIVYYN